MDRDRGTTGGVMDHAASPEPAAHYDRVHRAWCLIMGDEFHYGLFATPDTSLARATAAMTAAMRLRAAVNPGDRVLDVGCGTGRQSCDLAEQLGASVLGITTSEQGVAAATDLAATRGLDRVTFEVRDGTASGLPDAAFDVIWVLESSHLMRDRKALLTECVRVLRPGGRLALCDIVRRRDIPFLEVRSRREEFATLRAAFGDAHMEPLERYTETLGALGMAVTDGTDVTDATRPTFAAWRANVEAHEPRLVALLGRQGVDEFVAATHILQGMWDEGTLGYGLVAATRTR